ncbi:phosphoribosylformylglycinamidine cyclo-ligase [Modestobacter sp. I12A-02628]|uniref:Phosphoribosylformylglycinamidine cyclo-ligase n=1 Tax=Goekera deserti TaxID=2497753 RepID=A0A7K3W9I9_9ACTN|nr:phosphoribosylformylglycinamidine cyclo-ligase [Goekera deserti]MPQ98707.1 phosphoribosylformylglycinamidine cyclo-ligase [Goekera deserti]NDI49269.1 phosphoribosylformylglycinamidine cyclo-ligase [Goekera deserti]NEL53007.1 phosphoribosylformylglycinamidine cyclo-ligase [Goekera deserti]
MTEGFTYAAAGVDIDAGERAVTLMRSAVEATNRPEVVGGLGGFAGLFALDTARYTRPLLASSTDGVGTKIAIARALDRHDTVGIDLVAMVVDDLVACGAEPLFLQDYVACGRVVPERIAAIVTGIAAGCTQAGAALVGGETAEHGDLMGADDYDLAATAVGVVEADAVLGPERVRAGDVVVAMQSSGFHSNGYSLIRRVVASAGLDLHATPAGLHRTLGEELLEPTRIYALSCLALVAELGVDAVHAFAHITGGGLAGNTARVVPEGLVAVLDRSTWSLPHAVALLEEHGVPRTESERAFNCGVGMVAAVAPEAAQRAIDLLQGNGVPAWVAGEIGTRAEPTDPVARAVGAYR